MTIAQLQGQIAATELAYSRDLITFQNERFLNRDGGRLAARAAPLP
ncbi:hypothetical protein OG864_01470 [Streptomyces sp. NBC_00124]|nr:hypothetical protein [Streptomyces sp. NBC_00124]MCX5357432.1 hypothetical protein [Streptomyces sp. NBC_00124]